MASGVVKWFRRHRYPDCAPAHGALCLRSHVGACQRRAVGVRAARADFAQDQHAARSPCGRGWKVQHPTGGVVGEILVKEGSKVDEGQNVLRLRDTVTRSTLGVVRSQLDELMAREARLLAERD